MKTLLTFAALAALSLPAYDAEAQGPVRQGLRRTGEIAAQGTRRVAEGTGQVIRGTGQAAAGVARGAGQTAAGVARGVGQATAGVARGVGETAAGVARATGDVALGAAGATARGVDRLTPNLPLQARAGAQVGNDARDARWRFARHNNEWWYYSPEDRWMYHRNGQWNTFDEQSFDPQAGQVAAADAQPFQGEHTTGYRGDDPNAVADSSANPNGQQVMLHVDRYGREFICENGQRIYVTSHASGQEHSVGYRGDAAQNPSPTPAEPTDPQTVQPQATEAQSAQPPAPATPAPAVDASANGASVGAAASAEPQGEAVARQNANEGGASSPQSPRELNNNPDTAREGDASTSGSPDGDTLR